MLEKKKKLAAIPKFNFMIFLFMELIIGNFRIGSGDIC